MSEASYNEQQAAREMVVQAALEWAGALDGDLTFRKYRQASRTLKAAVGNYRKTLPVRCPRCGGYTTKMTEAEALADCPERDYAAEEREEQG